MPLNSVYPLAYRTARAKRPTKQFAYYPSRSSSPFPFPQNDHANARSLTLREHTCSDDTPKPLLLPPCTSTARPSTVPSPARLGSRQRLHYGRLTRLPRTRRPRPVLRRSRPPNGSGAPSGRMIPSLALRTVTSNALQPTDYSPTIHRRTSSHSSVATHRIDAGLCATSSCRLAR